MTTTDAEMLCPYCGRLNQAHTGRHGTRPTPDNSWAVCWGCHEVSMFTSILGHLGLRRLTPGEEADAAADVELQRAITAVRAAPYPQDAAAALWGSN